MTELDLIRAELRGLVDPDVGSGVTDPKAPEESTMDNERTLTHQGRDQVPISVTGSLYE